tara:strand:- start:259 stop:801 length:543 start_codon:yes stop_codon:yes gene_type:complete
MKTIRYQNGGKNGKQKTVKFADHSITSFQPSLRERAMAKGGASKNISSLSEEQKKKLTTKYRRGGKVEEPTISSSSGIDFRTEKQKKQDLRAERKQERKDEKEMIPAKYRNRGQAGLDRYKADMAKKRSRKNAKGLAKIFGTKAARKKSAIARKAARAAKRRMAGSRGAGCQGKGCGAYE